MTSSERRAPKSTGESLAYSVVPTTPTSRTSRPSRRRNLVTPKRPSENGGHFTGAMVRQNKERFPSRTVFEQISDGKKPGPGGPPNNPLKTLRDHLGVLRSTEGSTEGFPRQFGVENIPWVHAAKHAGKRHRGILEAVERLMARWHIEEENKSSERQTARGESVETALQECKRWQTG